MTDALDTAIVMREKETVKVCCSFSRGFPSKTLPYWWSKYKHGWKEIPANSSMSQKILDYIPSINFAKSKNDSYVSLFETTV